MTAKQLFRIAIKILGLFLLKEFITSAISAFSLIPFVFSNDLGGISYSVTLILVVITHAVLAYVCISRTDWLLSFLNLESGMSTEPINFQLHRSQVYLMTIIAISIYMMITELPTLVQQLSSYVGSSELNAYQYNKASSSALIASIARFGLGVCLFLIRRPLTNWLELQRKGAGKVTETKEA